MGISKDDRQAFKEATQDVKRLKRPDRVAVPAPRPKPIARQSKAAHQEMLAESLAATGGHQVDEIGYRRGMVSERTFRRLRRGHFSIEDEIDLHGLRRDEAKTELQRFFTDCRTRRVGCVRVVHGKGNRSGPDGPVLKESVQSWLARWDDVLAFASATTRHGGSGAVYVLLQQR